MGKQTIPSTENPKIWMHTGGDLIVHGWERSEISIESGDMQSLRIQQVGDTLQLESFGRLPNIRSSASQTGGR